MQFGKRQRELMDRAMRGPFTCATPAERWSALRLHDRGYLDRGRTSRDYTISNKGKEEYDGYQDS